MPTVCPDPLAESCGSWKMRTVRLRIAVLSFSWLARDPRLQRQFAALAGDHEVVAIGFGSSGHPAVRTVAIPLRARSWPAKAALAARLLLRDHRAAYWSTQHVRAACAALRCAAWDLIIANDLDALPAALTGAGAAPVIFDAHEYAPRELEESWWWRLLWAPHRRQLCRDTLPRCAAMMTVSPGIAHAYARLGGPTPHLVLNAPPFQQLAPSPPGSGPIRLVHHGVALRIRQLGSVLAAVRALGEGFTLDLLLVPGDPGHLEELQRLAAGCTRIRFLPPVPLADIVATLNRYDLGVHLLPLTSFNNCHALPNKLFEFIQARLGVIVGPSPAMAGIVRRRGVGAVTQGCGVGDLVRVLSSVTTADVARWKAAADAAAGELSAGHGLATIRSMVDSVVRRER